MPLKPGSSQAAISANIKIERAAGKPERQAVAIAESKARGDAYSGPGSGQYKKDRFGNTVIEPPKAQKPLGLTAEQIEKNRKADAAIARYKAEKAARKAGDCNVEMDEPEIEMDSLTAEEIEAAIAAGEKELKHQKAALQSLRAMDRRLTLAFDRRMETIDGHLIVYECNITKANVCPYLGSEIPGAEALGLDPSKIYMLYRDAVELKAAVATYDRVQLLMQHVAVNPDAPQQFITVGTVSNARFQHPYIKADLTVWTREGIDAIESQRQRELSCGYHYKPEMTPGTSPEGEKYDGRMTQIVCNHVALVEAGRAGPEVCVADAQLQVVRRLP